MPRIKVVPRIHTRRLAAMAFVIGLACGLLAVRLFLSVRSSTAAIGLALWFPLACVPVGLLLPLFDQRLRKQVGYAAAGSAGAVAALMTAFSGTASEFLACSATYFVLCWLVGLLAAGLGRLVSRACYRLTIQDGKTCPGCGYCLVGLSRRVCPECGRPFTCAELGTTPERLQAATPDPGDDQDAQ